MSNDCAGSEVQASDLLALEKYFYYAQRLRSSHEEYYHSVVDGRSQGNRHESWTWVSLWFSCLYVVIEGWNHLGLTDVTIDSLLESKNVALLKGFRHDTFHFQPVDFHPKRTAALIERADAPIDWAEKLTDSFGEFLKRQREKDGMRIGTGGSL